MPSLDDSLLMPKVLTQVRAIRMTSDAIVAALARVETGTAQ